MDALIGRVAVRTGQRTGRAAQLEIDAPTRGIELNLVHLPWRNQTQRAREQPLDANAHATLDPINSMPTGPDYHQPF